MDQMTDTEVEVRPLECPPFASFWGGGFDSVTPLVRLGRRKYRLDIIEATQHDQMADKDYGLLARLGIKWSREDIRWYRCEQAPGVYRFDHLEPILRAARRHGIEVVWSWMHYGCPSFVNPLDETFPDQLAALGERFRAWLGERGISACTVAPINELSHYTWRVGTLGTWHPFTRGQDQRLKEQLMLAHERCFERIKQSAPDVRVLLIEPFYHAAGREDDPPSMTEAARVRESTFEALDRLAPFADAIGLNFYFDGQVECYRVRGKEGYQRRKLPARDPRRVSLVEALRLYCGRFGKPMVVTETSVRATRRLPWLGSMTQQALEAIREGLPLQGMCWYPIMDVPDWGDLAEGETLDELRLAHSGLIRLDRTARGLRRSLARDVVQGVREMEAKLQRSLKSQSLGMAASVAAE
jgi:hypothetical protein